MMEFRTDDYEAQHNDQLQTEFKLEEIFFTLENGQPLDEEELTLLRYSCGMSKKQSPKNTEAEKQRLFLLKAMTDANNLMTGNYK